ncbi:MAG: DUF1223 domain-containing protein [Elusimicrobia bacterium]|nr:DUF1223 domain-containing protein [Elusimicrobiota bacterium]
MSILALIVACSPAWAASASFKSGPDRVSLLELYSSEGCSSCPPADDWLSSLASAKGLWIDFVPVAFQVDYWDRLGWKDPLASPEFTRRQERYARAWGGRGVYTPGVVLNGRELRAWGETPPSRLRTQAGTLEARELSPGAYQVSFEPSVAARGAWVAHAALLGFGFESRVLTGENEGKSLRHDFAALDLQEAALGEGGRARLRLRKKPGAPAKRYGAAFWITAEDDPTPVQAAGGFLP